MYPTSEEGARGDHDAAGAELQPASRSDTRDPVTLEKQSRDHLLEQIERLELVQNAPHGPRIQTPIALRAGPPDRGSLRAIEHAELDP